MKLDRNTIYWIETPLKSGLAFGAKQSNGSVELFMSLRGGNSYIFVGEEDKSRGTKTRSIFVDRDGKELVISNITKGIYRDMIDRNYGRIVNVTFDDLQQGVSHLSEKIERLKREKFRIL